jgi:hypothetical protein
MPWAFYNKYEAADKRKATIIASYVNSSGKTVDQSTGLRGAIPVKYTGVLGDGPGYSFDVVVFRYAEVLLSLAEAINEQRGPADAYQYVNMVRERAGVSDFAGMTQSDFRSALIDESGRELYCEGSRRQTLVRQGILISNAISQGNGVIKQNDGYSQ